MAKYYFTYEGDRYNRLMGRAPRKQPFKGGWTEIEAVSESAARSLYNAVHPETCDRERFSGYDFALTKYEMRVLGKLDNGVNGYKCVERITMNVEVLERGAMNA